MTTSTKGRIVTHSILKHAEKSIKLYGDEVILNRALPDYRDGLKPVHRRVLWSLHTMGVRYNKKTKKSARVTGDCIGKWHPHGDASVYDALAKMVSQLPVQLVDGQGEFGDHESGPAAARYTECRLSEFSDLHMLDPAYLQAVPMLPNYSDDELEPAYLPSKLPTLFLNGSSGIAVGLAQNIPSFSLESVKKCTVKAIRGTLTAAYMAKTLEFNFRYGGEAFEEENEILGVCKDGKGSVWFTPFYEVDEEKQEMRITSIAPNLTFMKTTKKSNALDPNCVAARILDIQGVAGVDDETGTSDKGEEEILYVIRTNKNINRRKFNEIVVEISSLIETREHYSVAVTERHADGSVDFWQTSLLEIMKSWAIWRVEIEKKVLSNKIADLTTSIGRAKLVILALDNIDIVIRALKVNEPVTFLCKQLEITDEQANYILNLRIRQLTKMEKAKIVESIKTMQSTKRELSVDLKAPENRIVKSINGISVN